MGKEGGRGKGEGGGWRTPSPDLFVYLFYCFFFLFSVELWGGLEPFGVGNSMAVKKRIGSGEFIFLS